MTEQGSFLPHNERLRAANLFVDGIKSYYGYISNPETPVRRILPGANAPAVQTLFRHPSADGMRNYARQIAMPLGIENSPRYDLSRTDVDQFFPALGFYPGNIPYGDVYFNNWMSGIVEYNLGLNEIKIRTVGYDAPTGPRNYISCLVGERAAWLSAMARYGDLKESPEISDRIELMGRAVMQLADAQLAAVGVRIFEFGNQLRNAKNMLMLLESLPGPLTIEEQRRRIALELQTGIKDPEQQTDELRAINDALFERTRELQEYGVKSAIAPSLLPSGQSLMREWLVVDPKTETRGILEAVGDNIKSHSVQYLSRPAATFFGTADRFVSSKITYGMGGTPFEHHGMPFVGAEVGAITEHADAPGIAVILGEDGQLKTLQGYDIREYVAHAGAGLFELEAMRAQILSIFADLVTPVYVNDLATHHAHVMRSEQQGKRKSEPSLRELVLARTRVIDVFHDEIIEDLAHEEDENTVVETVVDQTKQKKQMERHTVVGHTRKIPSTHRASPLARKNALEEAKVVLPEYGLTWETEHSRGNLEPRSKGHRAKFEHASPAREDIAIDIVDFGNT